MAAGRRPRPDIEVDEIPDRRWPLTSIHWLARRPRPRCFTLGCNDAHTLAMTQAICRYRKAHDIAGPLFMGWDQAEAQAIFERAIRRDSHGAL